MDSDFTGFFAIAALFIALPWIIFHYITKWKTMGTMTNEDEHLLEDLYQMAKRLDDRMDTVERIIAADNPDWRPARLTSADDQDDPALGQFTRMMQERGRK